MTSPSAGSETVHRDLEQHELAHPFRLKKLSIVLLLIAAALLALRLWHIRADFPDYHFYSQDGARFTDEGFYTGAAVRYFSLGHAYIAGGWNPAVFMPVWPFLAGLLFHFTGVSVSAARSLAVLCTWVSVLLAYAVSRQYRSQTFALATAFLIACNALGFFFARLAILEPAFVMWLLLAIYLAGRVRPGNYGLAITVGISFTVLTLTKTTGPFVLPAVLYPIWANNRMRRRDAWKLLAVSVGVIALLLGCAKIVWFLHYHSDSRIILGLSPVWQLENAPMRLLRFFFRGTWIDPVLFPLALACFIAAVSRLRFLWRDTLFATALLWEAGYAAFIAFHYDGPPRYFVTLIVPTIWLTLIFAQWLWHHHRYAGFAVAGCIVISITWNIWSIANYLLHPQYTLVNASLRIKHLIETQQDDQTKESNLLIGRGAEEIALLSDGMPAMDSDGAMPLKAKIDVYDPGWFMVWTDDPPLRAIYVSEKKRMLQRAIFPNLDHDDGAGIVLYRLLPKVHP